MAARVLDTDDFRIIRRLLRPAASNWRGIGIELKFSMAELDEIEADVRGVQDRFARMLSKWLNRAPPHHDRPTIEDLAEALRREDQENLAHCLPRKFKRAKREERRKRGNRVQSVIDRTDERRERERDAVVDDEERIHGISTEIRGYHSRLQQLKTDLFARIEAHVEPRELKDVLTLPPPDIEDEHEDFIEQHKALLTSDTDDLREIFFEVNRYSGYLNYTLIEYLIEEFGTAELKTRMNKYASDVQRFRRTTPLALFSKAGRPMSKIPEGFKELVTTHDFPPDATLEDVEEFRLRLAPRYNLHYFALWLYSVQTGSIVLTWLVPKCFTDSIIAKSKSIDFAALGSHLTRVTFENEVLYTATSRQPRRQTEMSKQTEVKIPMLKVPEDTQSIRYPYSGVQSELATSSRVSGVSGPMDSGYGSQHIMASRVSAKPICPSVKEQRADDSYSYFSMCSSDFPAETSSWCSYHSGETKERSSSLTRDRDWSKKRGQKKRRSRKHKHRTKKRDCLQHKLLGKCEKINCCLHHHTRATKAYYELLQIPNTISVGMVIGHEGANIKQLRQCLVELIADKREIKIISADRKKLLEAVEKYKLLMSQAPVAGPSWCYIHPQGITRSGKYWFQAYEGRTPPRASGTAIWMLELRSNKPGQMADSTFINEFAAMSPQTPQDTTEGLLETLEKVHGDIHLSAEETNSMQRTRIEPQLEERIKRTLTDGLGWLCKKRQEGARYITRLEARFGKVMWGNFPEGMSITGNRYNITELCDKLFMEAQHTNIFNTDVKPTGAENMRSILTSQPFCRETLDIKLTTAGTGDRLDIRLLVNRPSTADEKPSTEVLNVKKNEIKVATIDILSLHRQHDVRIGLHHYDDMHDGDPLYETIQKMVRTISFPTCNKVVFIARTGDWNVHLIRHKKKQTYMIDARHAVTIASLAEHKFNCKRGKKAWFDISSPSEHSEVELHNLAWECAFGRDVSLLPRESLELHMEPGVVDPALAEAIPHPWQPAHIMQDFEQFWEHLDTLNGSLGHMVVAKPPPVPRSRYKLEDFLKDKD